MQVVTKKPERLYLFLIRRKLAECRQSNLQYKQTEKISVSNALKLLEQVLWQKC